MLFALFGDKDAKKIGKKLQIYIIFYSRKRKIGIFWPCTGFRQGFQVPPLKLGPPKHLGPPKYFLGAGPPNIFVPLENYKYRKSNSKRDNTIPNTFNEWFLGKQYAYKSCLNVFWGDKEAPQAKILEIWSGKTSKSTVVGFHDGINISFNRDDSSPPKICQMTQVPPAKEGPPRNIYFCSPRDKYPKFCL